MRSAFLVPSTAACACSYAQQKFKFARWRHNCLNLLDKSVAITIRTAIPTVDLPRIFPCAINGYGGRGSSTLPFLRGPSCVLVYNVMFSGARYYFFLKAFFLRMQNVTTSSWQIRRSIQRGTSLQSYSHRFHRSPAWTVGIRSCCHRQKFVFETPQS